jgi:hypothetical protein
VVEREEQGQLPPAVVAGQAALIQCEVLQQPCWARVSQLLLEQGEQAGQLKPIPTPMEIWAVPEEILLLEHGLLQQKGLALGRSQQQADPLGQPHLLEPCLWARTEALEALEQQPAVLALILLPAAPGEEAGED